MPLAYNHARVVRLSDLPCLRQLVAQFDHAHASPSRSGVCHARASTLREFDLVRLVHVLVELKRLKSSEQEPLIRVGSAETVRSV